MFNKAVCSCNSHGTRKSIGSYPTTRLIAALFFVISSVQAFAQSEEAVALYKRGLEANQNGKLIEASVLFTEAIAIYPKYAEAYYQRGLSFIGMKRAENGMKDFQQAVGHKVQNLNPYLRLIKWHNTHNRFQASLIITDQIIANMPENAAGAYWDKGQIYERMNKRKLAIAAYQASLRALDSDNADFAKTLKSRIVELQK